MRIRNSQAVACAAVVLLAPLVGGGELAAQSDDDHATAAERVVRSLLSSRPDYAFPRDGQAWGLVVGQFAKGDQKTLEFDAAVGETYVLLGIGVDGADVDIRLFDPQGTLIGEDLLDDNVPVVSFTADSPGTYRVIMSAAAVEGGSSYAGMVVLRPPNDSAH